jgi:hypothetical protein
MSIDYEGVGGIGIKLTDDLIEKLIEKNIFTKDEWEEDARECLERLNIYYKQAGNVFTEIYYWYLMVDGDNLKEINENVDQFIIDIKNKIGIDLTLSDLKVIEDCFIL